MHPELRPRWAGWRGLRARVLVAAAVCAVAAIVPVMFVTGLAVSQQAIRVTLHPRAPGVAASAEACQAATGPWTEGHMTNVRGYGYDVTTGQSDNPAAPELNPALLAALQAGAPNAGELNLFFPRPGGQAVTRTQFDTGPCSVLGVHWSPFGGSRPAILRPVLVISVISLIAGIFFTQWLALRPLLRRLEALREDAVQVGSASFQPTAAGPADAISDVSSALETAHTRIEGTESSLRERQRALERHMSNVAHDLRTPIAGLQLVLEDIADGGPDAPGLAQRALRDLSYLSALTENLREAARLDEGVHPLAGDPRIDLVTLVESVEARFAAIGRRRGVSVVAATPEGAQLAVCDGSMAERVVANLVGNAVDAVDSSDTGSHVAISLEVHERQFELTVMDDGPGIPADLLTRIGQRHLRQAGPSKGERSRRGTGLGLSIVHEVCDKAGWQLEFGTLDGGTGTRVTIAGPLAA